MRRFLRDNGLTLALLSLFLLSLVGHWLTGVHVENTELLDHGRKPISAVAYLTDPQFLSSVFENWESEFLQMGMYVLLTAILFQRGSAESKDPDAKPRDAKLNRKTDNTEAPAALRKGPLIRWLYAHSLSSALFALFAVSFGLHWFFSAKQAAERASMHGQAAESLAAYLFDPGLWFESFQNWQSEFLSAGVLVVLSIWLRQKDSPESKPVTAPHSQTGT